MVTTTDKHSAKELVNFQDFVLESKDKNKVRKIKVRVLDYPEEVGEYEVEQEVIDTFSKLGMK